MKNLYFAIWDGIRAYYITQYLNDGWIDETEYIQLYNFFAENNNIPKLETVNDIYTEKNRHDDFIRYVVRYYNTIPFYNSIYSFVEKIISDIRESER